MKTVPIGYSETLDQKSIQGATAVAWISRKSEDQRWDSFLETSPVGQFQQSSIWSRAKEPSWKPVRVIITLDEQVVGGFQILRHSHWWGDIGYLSKGPVVPQDSPTIAAYVTELIQKITTHEGLRALVIQPPDCCERMPSLLKGGEFELDVLAGVNSATWIIDIGGGFEAVEQRMDGEARRKVRQAIKRGLSIREGGREDLELFFDLMLQTCKRQNVGASPSSVSMVHALWDSGHPVGCVRVYFSQYCGNAITGLIDIGFGKTVTQWKKGWNSTESQRNPNDLSTYAALQWAVQRRYEFYDFAAMDRRIAIAMLKGEPLTEAQQQSRCMFFTRFGGRPVILPESRVYFPNRMARLAYRIKMHRRIEEAEQESNVAEELRNHALMSRF
jgi:hypothetical protein